MSQTYKVKFGGPQEWSTTNQGGGQENKNKVKRSGLHRIDQKDAVEYYLVFTDLVQGKSFLSQIDFLSQIEKVCDE